MTMRLPKITALALLFLAVTLAYGFAQTADPTVEPQTWREAFALWVPQAVAALLAGISVVLTLAIRQAVALLPDFIRAWIDAKRQRDLHSAIMSKVAALIAEGRWPTLGDLQDIGGAVMGKAAVPAIPGALIKEIHDYATVSVPQAVRHYGLSDLDARGDMVIRNLATRFSLQLQGGQGEARP